MNDERLRETILKLNACLVMAEAKIRALREDLFDMANKLGVRCDPESHQAKYRGHLEEFMIAFEDQNPELAALLQKEIDGC